MKKLLSFGLFLILPLSIRAQSSYYADSPSQPDVNDCINGTGVNTCHAGSPGGVQATHTAVAGDVINVPGGIGSITWTTGIATSTPISIIGPGASALIINVNIPAANGCSPVFHFTPSSVGSLSRVSGFTIQPLAGNTTSCLAIVGFGTCALGGCPNIRIDHNVFPGWANISHNPGYGGYGITAVGDMFGVLDHNTVNGAGGFYTHLVEVNHAAYLGQGQFGDYSWNQPENYGSANFLFIEDNTFNTAGCCEDETSPAGYPYSGGSRAVVRYNTFNSMENINFAFGWHGFESGGRARSGRAFEFYQNSWNCTTSCIQTLGVRGGTGLTWGNTMTWPGLLQYFFTLTTYRVQGAPDGLEACDGSSVVDTNDGTTYYSDTIGSYNSNTNVITVTGSPGWTVNQWAPAGAPYSVHDVTRNTGAEIASNGSNTLTLNGAVNGGAGAAWTPVNGDSIQILRATVCLDQAGGRGAGFLYTGSVVNMPGPSQAGNQALSPAYFWSNSFGGGGTIGNDSAVSGVHSFTGRVIQNRDFYAENTNQAAQSNATTPFDGTTTIGIGHGTLARKPTTCTTGVGYWATDTTTFYKCTSTNTWTSYYIPYTYPHPLITGQVDTPAFSPVAGTYSSSQNVAISSTTGGATICYTTDGSTPTADGAGTCTHGSTYSAPIFVTSSLTIKAVGSLSGKTDSPVGGASYTIILSIPTGRAGVLFAKKGH